MKNLSMLVSMLAVLFTLSSSGWADNSPGTVPIVYVTDLYHPHDDPDDHYDLATLYAVPEFDIRGIVIDMGQRGVGRPAICAIKQLNSITGRNVPYATGLTANLSSPEDRAQDQPESEQGGITLILNLLHVSDMPVVLFTTGSMRDVAAAYNREPETFKKKVSRLYMNVGQSSGGEEWNVDLDRHAYFRILESDLPIYWMPCFGDNGYGTYWKFTQSVVLESLSTKLQNFFIFALQQENLTETDPLNYLNRTPDEAAKEKIWPAERNMWCTAGFLHAAGRPDPTFEFKDMPVRINKAEGKTIIVPDGNERKIKTFYRTDQDTYTRSMTETLKTLLSQLGN